MRKGMDADAVSKPSAARGSLKQLPDSHKRKKAMANIEYIASI